MTRAAAMSLILLAGISQGRAQDERPVPKEGLAALYPGDEGIEKDPRVLFVEDFETGALKEIAARWGGHRLAGTWDLPEDLHGASPGKRSLHIGVGPEGPKNHSGAYLYTHVRGVDRLHARFYVKFHPKHGYLHHFVFLIADREPTPWPKGWAGSRPAGDSHFLSAIEPWSQWGKVPPPGAWNFYSYWQDMKPDGRGDYWGNSFQAGAEPIERGRWYCIEAMVKANSTPEAADGEQVFWVDGKKAGEFKGIRWRSTDKLKLNSFWLQYDVCENSPQHNSDPDPKDRAYEIWFDDIVLATDYIGPVQGRPKSGRKAAATARSAPARVPPGKVVFSETFESGAGKFRGGEVAEGALSVPVRGAEIWNAWSIPVRESTTIRFKLKPLAEIGPVTLLVWSDTLKDNGRASITGLKKDQWREVEVRGVDLRTGGGIDGPGLDGNLFNNLKLVFEGAAGARVLIDDFEIRE